jgi:hypothetical protein
MIRSDVTVILSQSIIFTIPIVCKVLIRMVKMANIIEVVQLLNASKLCIVVCK